MKDLSTMNHDEVKSYLFPNNLTFKLRNGAGEIRETYLHITNYSANGNLAIFLLNECEIFDGSKDFEDYASLTVNIIGLGPFVAAIDVNNLPPTIIEDLTQANLIEDLNSCVESGFCSYPLVRFIPEQLRLFNAPETDEYLAKFFQKVNSLIPRGKTGV